ncbi:hypothetical protein MTR67_027124 [Solanum verrucosum]|uniref:Uncharacterized protein n=1 Tax=Solanum verrucosum TaxID=315347 RepID=A0AAF0R920_SOLVR|nr:hypothetical protein MTR67_027124 [Solanum verrucosum]
MMREKSWFKMFIGWPDWMLRQSNIMIRLW